MAFSPSEQQGLLDFSSHLAHLQAVAALTAQMYSLSEQQGLLDSSQPYTGAALGAGGPPPQLTSHLSSVPHTRSSIGSSQLHVEHCSEPAWLAWCCLMTSNAARP
eukprot:1157844-Pelagomonas_calceolata.AAC.1